MLKSRQEPPRGPEPDRVLSRSVAGSGLPPGYRFKGDADLLILLGPDGSEVAAFSAQGADPAEVFAAAREDHE